MGPLFHFITARRPLRKITANYTPRSVAAIEMAKDLSGDNQSDTLNRAAQIYAYLLWLRKENTADAETVTRLLGQL